MKSWNEILENKIKFLSCPNFLMVGMYIKNDKYIEIYFVKIR